jgi:hypothetical protein
LDTTINIRSKTPDPFPQKSRNLCCVKIRRVESFSSIHQQGSGSRYPAQKASWNPLQPNVLNFNVFSLSRAILESEKNQLTYWNENCWKIIFNQWLNGSWADSNKNTVPFGGK